MVDEFLNFARLNVSVTGKPEKELLRHLVINLYITHWRRQKANEKRALVITPVIDNHCSVLSALYDARNCSGGILYCGATSKSMVLEFRPPVRTDT